MMTSSFLSAYQGMIPAGPILFLGAGDGIDARTLAKLGRSVCVLDTSSESGALGFQCWAAVISVFANWPERQRRRLFGQIPNALKPGGVFLMEAYALGPSGPLCLDDRCLDPVDVRPELEMLHVARFATSYDSDDAAVLQIVGVHPEGSSEPIDEPCPDLPIGAAPVPQLPVWMAPNLLPMPASMGGPKPASWRYPLPR